MQLMVNSKPLEVSAPVAEVLRELDADKDGIVSTAELHAAEPWLQEWLHERLVNERTHLDKLGNGVVALFGAVYAGTIGCAMAGSMLVDGFLINLALYGFILGFPSSLVLVDRMDRVTHQCARALEAVRGLPGVIARGVQTLGA